MKLQMMWVIAPSVLSVILFMNLRNPDLQISGKAVKHFDYQMAENPYYVYTSILYL
jgi:hypothetical protein